MGLDIGRRWTGLAVSDAQLLEAKPLKTLELLSAEAGMEGDMRDLCRKIKNTIRSKHCKGLIIGYPLDEKNEPTRHCQYIQYFLETLCREE